MKSDTCCAVAASRLARSRSAAIRLACTAIITAKAISTSTLAAAAATRQVCRRTNFFAR